jgi:hypothetical protein
MLKASAHTRDPTKGAPGTSMTVPKMVGLRPKTSRALANPDALLTQHLGDALPAFG